MNETLYFATDAAIISRLGRELVARQETALIELVKNSFDADATHVTVRFTEDGALEIEDDGIGMSRAVLIDSFLRLASDFKVQSPFSPHFKRRRAGRKGIGRFATQRLGDVLVLRTTPEGSSAGLMLTVDWTKFTSGRDLGSVDVTLSPIDSGTQGTTLRIEKLNDEWTDAQIRRCWRGVLALQQPFPVAKIKSKPAADPGFSVEFRRADEFFGDENTVADFKTEILDHLHAVIELSVSDDGFAKWRISANRFGESRPWMKVHHEHLDSSTPPPYKHLKSAAMKTHYVILSPDLLPSLVYARVRDVLADQGGVRLYRNGFRVVPYGDAGNDWLRLDEIYSKRAILAPIANRNFFGVIEVTDVEGRLFEEHTSREGLIETPAFIELRSLASAVLVSAATRIAEDRGRKTRAGASRPRPERAPSADALHDLDAALKATQDAAIKAAANGAGHDAAEAVVAQVREATRILEEKKEEIATAEARLADEAAMLRFLATLGMTTAEFSHETGMTFDAFRLDFQAVFEMAKLASHGDAQLLAQSERASSMLARLDTLTSYLNTLAAARTARGMRPISLARALHEFHLGVVSQARAQGVELIVEIPPYDPLFTTPMHEAEIASILLNLYTNAVKAIKRANGERKILVKADRISDETAVRIQFFDSGDGIPDSNLDRVFDAFFTTRTSAPAGSSDVEHAKGTGLGLWIVHQIIENSSGRIFASSPADNFSTCFDLRFPSEPDL